MTFVIIVLFIAFVFVSLHDGKKNYEQSAGDRAKNSRKTNAALERSMVDKYLREGYTFDESFEKAYDYMICSGFDPCIPKKAYRIQGRPDVETSNVPNLEQYDSFIVRTMKTDKKHKIITGDIYDNFPSNNFEYDAYLDRSILLTGAVPVGEYLIHPRYGLCKVLSRKIFLSNKNGVYICQRVDTKETVRISLKDKTIRRQ